MRHCGSEITRRKEPVLRLHRDGRGTPVNHRGLHEGSAELFVHGEDRSTAGQYIGGERMSTMPHAA